MFNAIVTNKNGDIFAYENISVILTQKENEDVYIEFQFLGGGGCGFKKDNVKCIQLIPVAVTELNNEN